MLEKHKFNIMAVIARLEDAHNLGSQIGCGELCTVSLSLGLW